MEYPFDYKNYEGFMADDADPSVLVSGKNVKRTASLFAETMTRMAKSKGIIPLYTMKDVPYYKYQGFDMEPIYIPSAYRIYMNSIDETEAAYKLVGSLGHWRRLIMEHTEEEEVNSKWYCHWFMCGKPTKNFDGLLQWREDMEARDRMYAKRALQRKIEEEGNVTAAKQFLDYGIGEQKKVKQKKNFNAKDFNLDPIKTPVEEDIDKDMNLLEKYKGASDG